MNGSTIPLLLSLTRRHVDEMLDRFDSGLCDAGTANAICLALREQARVPRSFRVFFDRGTLRAGVDGEWIELSDDLASWLREAMIGKSVPERTVEVRLPFAWLRPSAGVEFSRPDSLRPKGRQPAATIAA